MTLPALKPPQAGRSRSLQPVRQEVDGGQDGHLTQAITRAACRSSKSYTTRTTRTGNSSKITKAKATLSRSRSTMRRQAVGRQDCYGAATFPAMPPRRWSPANISSWRLRWLPNGARSQNRENATTRSTRNRCRWADHEGNRAKAIA